MIHNSMEVYGSCGKVQEYVPHANGEIEDLLLHEIPIPERAWLPSSPEPSSPAKVAPIHRDPLPGSVPRRVGKFVYPPPNKRTRGKTLPRASSHSHMPPTPPHIEEQEAAENFAADEEAASHLCIAGRIRAQ